jgi:hypothetical protein
MRMARWMLSLAVGITISGSAHAHHSISTVYDSRRQKTIEGTVTEFQFVNPHPFLLVDVTDAVGNTQRWSLEMDNRSELAAIGVTANTFKQGDRLVVSGSLARTQPQKLYVRTLERPADRFWYEQAGESPRIRTGSR